MSLSLVHLQMKLRPVDFVTDLTDHIEVEVSVQVFYEMMRPHKLPLAEVALEIRRPVVNFMIIEEGP